MATIRAYTTIEQSRKLAKILPLESADMYWYLATKGNPIAMFNERYNEYGDFELPCWSLAALLGVLPDELEDNHFLTLDKEGNEYCCCYEDGNGNSFKHEFADNPVDACVAMIEKIHELKML